MTGGADDDRTRPGASGGPIPGGGGGWDSRHDERTLPGAGAEPLPAVPGVTLDREIARGGMGVVYRGRQDYLDREVAVKVLSEHLQGGTFAQRFQREAKILAGIKHPNIVACHMAGVNDRGLCYLVMEFVDGPTLKDWLEANGPMHPESALHLAKALAGALLHAHELNVIHRDVKAENVLLEAKTSTTIDPRFPFSPKLVDLGIARIHSESGSHEIGLTSPGSVVGTPTCMAPEQFDTPELVDFRADIYGLGCVLYRSLTAQIAFDGGKLTSLVMQKREPLGPDPRKVRPELSERLAEFVRSLMAGERDNRPASYQALIRQIDDLLKTELLPPAEKASGGSGLLGTAEFSFLAEGGLVGKGDGGASSPFQGTMETPRPATATGPVATEVVESQQIERPRTGASKVGMLAGFAVVAVAALGAAWWATNGGGDEDTRTGAGGNGGDGRPPFATRPEEKDPTPKGSTSESAPTPGPSVEPGPTPETDPGGARPNAAPTVAFEPPEALGIIGRLVNLSATGKDADGEDLTYAWSFAGDVEVEFEEKGVWPNRAVIGAKLIRGRPGQRFTITVVARDPRGGEGVATRAMRVKGVLDVLAAVREKWLDDLVLDEDQWAFQEEKGYLFTLADEPASTLSLPLEGARWQVAATIDCRPNNSPAYPVVTAKLVQGDGALVVRVTRSGVGGATWTARAEEGERRDGEWTYAAPGPSGESETDSVTSWTDETDDPDGGLWASVLFTLRDGDLSVRYGSADLEQMPGYKLSAETLDGLFGEGWQERPFTLEIESVGGRGIIRKLLLF